MRRNGHFLYLFLIGLLLFTRAQTVQAQTPTPRPVIHAILFYSPACGHCHIVITEVLPPLMKQYGDQLFIVGIDASQPGGQDLYQAAMQHFHLESSGVPFLVVGETYLLGSVDIPEKFPGLIEHYLAQGGVDWPAIPGLAQALTPPQPTEVPSATLPPIEDTPSLATAIPSASPTPVAPTPNSTPGILLSGNSTSGLGGNFANDPQGNSLAIVVLVGLILSMGGAILAFRRLPGATLTNLWGWATPIVCLIGLGVAGYLAYVETTQVQAVCGPVGDCNTVQQSEYARLFGILPIGILGMVGYCMILLAWAVARFASQPMVSYASLAQLGMSVFGVLFSTYLTFLEPFVIGATCAWCLTSAILMTALFWLSISPGKLAFTFLFYGEKQALKEPDS